MDAVVCGIDPGLNTTGYAVVVSCASGEVTLLDAGVCRIEADAPLAVRLNNLQTDVANIFDEHPIEIVAVEQLYSHYNHPRTAILMGHARGVILAAAGKRGMRVESYPATHVKRRLTGNGRASKQQIQRAIQTALGLSDLPEPADLADALAIALCAVTDSHQPCITEQSV